MISSFRAIQSRAARSANKICGRAFHPVNPPLGNPQNLLPARHTVCSRSIIMKRGLSATTCNTSNNEKESKEIEEETTDDVKETASISQQIPGTIQRGSGKQLAIVYTCGVCNTRSMKQFTERAYQQGVVIVRCPGCSRQHLIADRLGYFDDNWDIQKVAAQEGNESAEFESVLEIDLEDLLGKEKFEQLLQQHSHENVEKQSEKDSSKKSLNDRPVP